MLWFSTYNYFRFFVYWHLVNFRSMFKPWTMAAVAGLVSPLIFVQHCWGRGSFFTPRSDKASVRAETKFASINFHPESTKKAVFICGLFSSLEKEVWFAWMCSSYRTEPFRIYLATFCVRALTICHLKAHLAYCQVPPSCNPFGMKTKVTYSL